MPKLSDRTSLHAEALHDDCNRCDKVGRPSRGEHLLKRDCSKASSVKKDALDRQQRHRLPLLFRMLDAKGLP